MSKQQELDIILRAISALGPNSYCGPWLAKQTDYLTHCMLIDHMPETTEEVLDRLARSN